MLYRQPQYRVGILNTKNGKVVREKWIQDEAIYLDEKGELPDKVLNTAKKMSEWFDNKDTFFSGKPIWEYWAEIGFVGRIKKLIEGSGLNNVACESVAVFEGNRGTEHEFFVERVGRR